MATRREFSDFLSKVELRAYKQALFAVQDEHAALDIVQDSLMKLTEKYADKFAWGIATVVSAYSAEYHSCLLSMAENAINMDDAIFVIHI